MPLKYILTGGQEAECKLAIPAKASAVLAGKAYDTNELRTCMECRKIKAVIPPKSNKIEAVSVFVGIIKERHVIECLPGKLKHYRRIATGYEKKSINYIGMLSFSFVLVGRVRNISD